MMVALVKKTWINGIENRTRNVQNVVDNSPACSGPRFIALAFYYDTFQPRGALDHHLSFPLPLLVFSRYIALKGLIA
jgi:hypothetical protein